MRVALCQMAVTSNKAANIGRAASVIAQAKTTERAELVVLPECFNCPYGTKYFADYAEGIPAVGSDCTASASPTVAAIGKAARDNQVWIVAGSIPECDDAKKLYNASMTVDPQGVLRGLHRKVHLFKINTETVKFDESEVLTAGDTPTVVDMDDKTRLGVGICFDIRYPQLAAHYHEAGTRMLVYPGAFNMVTGPAHWLLCARSRAVDAQQFVALCSPARDEKADYVAYGNSMLVDPWGEVVAKADDGEECIIAADVDWSLVDKARTRLPISAGKRTDLYQQTWRGVK